MKRSMGGGNKGNKSVVGKNPTPVSKGRSMIGKGGKAGAGRKRGGKQRKMLTG